MSRQSRNLKRQDTTAQGVLSKSSNQQTKSLDPSKVGRPLYWMSTMHLAGFREKLVGKVDARTCSVICLMLLLMEAMADTSNGSVVVGVYVEIDKQIVSRSDFDRPQVYLHLKRVGCGETRERSILRKAVGWFSQRERQICS